VPPFLFGLVAAFYSDRELLRRDAERKPESSALESLLLALSVSESIPRIREAFARINRLCTAQGKAELRQAQRERKRGWLEFIGRRSEFTRQAE
jgi:hypothetical protein